MTQNHSRDTESGHFYGIGPGRSLSGRVLAGYPLPDTKNRSGSWPESDPKVTLLDSSETRAGGAGRGSFWTPLLAAS